MQQDTGFLQYLLVRAIDIYAFMIIVRVIMSWFTGNPNNAIYRFLIQMTEPLLGRIRRLLPRSGLDFSPLIAIILLEILSSIIMGM